MNVEAENQNKMDTPYVIEMENEDEDVMKDVADYDAGLISAVSSSWSSASGSAAERQFGDSGNQKCMAREERRSMTNKIDTHGEFDSRSLQATPVIRKWRTRLSRRHPSSLSFFG